MDGLVKRFFISWAFFGIGMHVIESYLIDAHTNYRWNPAWRMVTAYLSFEYFVLKLVLGVLGIAVICFLIFKYFEYRSDPKNWKQTMKATPPSSPVPEPDVAAEYVAYVAWEERQRKERIAEERRERQRKKREEEKELNRIKNRTAEEIEKDAIRQITEGY